MKTINYIIRVMAAASVMAAACSCGGNKEAESLQEPAAEAVKAKVSVTSAVIGEVPQSEVYSTTVMPNAVNNIVPQSGSRIQKINVEVGDFVTKGQILAEMDQVTLDQARLQLMNTETEFERIKGLYEVGGVSKSDFESMELSYKVNKSKYENLLENTILRSPIDGVITARNYDRGDMYGMGSPIFVVQQITPVKLLVGISETDYTRVKRGDKVTLTADALPGETFTGQISRIYPTVDAASHTFNAEVLVGNTSRRLRPGMYARVNVTFAVNNSIIIPDSAVNKQQGSGQKSVFVLNADNTVTSTVVTLGRHFGGQYEVLEGLSEGDKVVYKGQTALQNGSEVTVISEQ